MQIGKSAVSTKAAVVAAAKNATESTDIPRLIEFPSVPDLKTIADWSVVWI